MISGDLAAATKNLGTESQGKLFGGSGCLPSVAACGLPLFPEGNVRTGDCCATDSAEKPKKKSRILLSLALHVQKIREAKRILSWAMRGQGVFYELSLYSGLL